MTVILIIFGALVLAALISAVDCVLNINVTVFTEALAGLNAPVKAVCISDLHGRSYGRNNRRLISLIAVQTPDTIIVAGDMLTRRAGKKQCERMLSVLKALTEIAPVFYAAGNHEADFMEKHGREWLDRVSETGATVLFDSFAELSAGDGVLRIGGVAGRYFDGSERDEASLRLLREIGAEGVPSIAIVHQPENLWKTEQREGWSAGLYLCGHNHGGVWRIPFVGGVMSPAEGLFPKYDVGRYTLKEGTPFIINGGLSGYYFIPRIFNRPEICVIKLIKK